MGPNPPALTGAAALDGARMGRAVSTVSLMLCSRCRLPRCHACKGATMAALPHTIKKHQRRAKRNDAFTQMRQSLDGPVRLGPPLRNPVELSTPPMPKVVLIVDDDPAQRRILEETIRRLGHGTRSAPGGEQALQILEGPDRAEIGLVLLDHVMPGTGGMEVLQRVARKPGPPPIIMQTAHGSIDAAISAMRSGAVDFVVKPTS